MGTQWGGPHGDPGTKMRTHVGAVHTKYNKPGCKDKRMSFDDAALAKKADVALSFSPLVQFSQPGVRTQGGHCSVVLNIGQRDNLQTKILSRVNLGHMHRQSNTANV